MERARSAEPIRAVEVGCALHVRLVEKEISIIRQHEVAIRNLQRIIAAKHEIRVQRYGRWEQIGCGDITGAVMDAVSDGEDGHGAEKVVQVDDAYHASDGVADVRAWRSVRAEGVCVNENRAVIRTGHYWSERQPPDQANGD